MRNKNQPPAESGMTIVEMAVGLALVAILAGSLVSMGILAIRTSNLARMKAKALRYAEEGIEIARKTRDQISPSSLGSLLSACPVDASNCCVVDGLLFVCLLPEDLEGGIFIRTIDVGEVVGVPAEEKVLVTVEVTWQNGEKSIDLKTFLTAWAD